MGASWLEKTCYQAAVTALCMTVAGLGLSAFLSLGPLSGFDAASAEGVMFAVFALTGLCLLCCAVATGAYVAAVRRASSRAADAEEPVDA